MNEEIKKELVESLRSGRYKQTDSVLRRENSYCCLGVLCDISTKYGIGEWVEDEYGDTMFKTSNGTRISVLPKDVLEWAGLGDKYGSEVYIEKHSLSLTTMNDEGYSFEKIADIIEEEL